MTLFIPKHHAIGTKQEVLSRINTLRFPSEAIEKGISDMEVRVIDFGSRKKSQLAFCGMDRESVRG
jgi:hypothetical protein